MITACKTVSFLDSKFCSYRYSVLNHISSNTHSLFLLDSVYLSMFLIFSRSCCCFAKLREAMDGTSLKMHNLLLWECCIWRNTVDLQGFLLHKVLVLLAPCFVIVTRHLHIRMFFHLFHLWNVLVLKMNLVVFRLIAKKTERFFPRLVCSINLFKQSNGCSYIARGSYLFRKN